MEILGLYLRSNPTDSFLLEKSTLVLVISINLLVIHFIVDLLMVFMLYGQNVRYIDIFMEEDSDANRWSFKALNIFTILLFCSKLAAFAYDTLF